jgi:hypothetical protein
MIKKLALVLTVLMIVFLAWALWGPGLYVTINGHEITSPFDAIVGVWGLILSVAIIFFVGIILALVFAGVGLIILGCLALVGLILAVIASPFLLPLLIPLFIVWIICSLARKTKTA